MKFCEEILNLLPKFSLEHVLSGDTNSILNLLLLMLPESEVKKAVVINSEYRALPD